MIVVANTSPSHSEGYLLISTRFSFAESSLVWEEKVVFTPIAVERDCVQSTPVNNFVLHICSQVFKRTGWLREPELRFKKMEWTRTSGRDNKYEFIVYYSLKNDISGTLDFKIELNINESPDGFEGEFIANAVTQGLKIKGNCFAIFNGSKEIQSAHIILLD